MSNPILYMEGLPVRHSLGAGKQKALADPKGLLIFEFLRFIEYIRPSYFVMENVSNIVSIGGGKLYATILHHMDFLGYNVSVNTLCAADYGVPQLET